MLLFFALFCFIRRGKFEGRILLQNWWLVIWQNQVNPVGPLCVTLGNKFHSSSKGLQGQLSHSRANAFPSEQGSSLCPTGLLGGRPGPHGEHTCLSTLVCTCCLLPPTPNPSLYTGLRSLVSQPLSLLSSVVLTGRLYSTSLSLICLALSNLSFPN